MWWVWHSSSHALFAPCFKWNVRQSVMLLRGSRGFIWTSHFCCHRMFSFIIIHTCIFWCLLNISIFISLSHHRRTVMDNIIFHLCSQEVQIATARQVERLRAPVGTRNCGPKLPWVPSSHISDTLRIGCVTFADLKSIMTLSPFSVLRRTRFT